VRSPHKMHGTRSVPGEPLGRSPPVEAGGVSIQSHTDVGHPPNGVGLAHLQPPSPTRRDLSVRITPGDDYQIY
jgi:hypothetical protein